MAAEKNNVTTGDKSFKLERIFAAPRSLVYDAWTKKEHMDKWSCPNGFTLPESTADFRVGGKWHTLMIAPNGEHYPLGGLYKEIVPNEKLVMTHCWEDDDGKPEHETTVTVRFEDACAGKTRMIMEQSIFKSNESRDGHIGGWSECIEKLDALLAELQEAA